MSLEAIVNQTYKKFTDYKNPDQAVTQMSSLGSLSGDLYQDSKRFIYELLQNADDSALPGIKSKVIIKLFNNVLVVAHNGKTFDEPDVIGISDVGNGTKRNANDKTGYKGIGFKSVFGQSNRVFIYSDSELFRFDETFEPEWPEEWEISKDEWEKANDRQFKFPWPIIPIYTNPLEINPEIWTFLEESHYTVATIIELYRPQEIEKSISELVQKIEMYLFLKNIEEIIFENNTSTVINIHEDSNAEINISVNGESKIMYLKKAYNLDVPEYLRTILQNDKEVPDKIKQVKTTEITLAAKRTKNGFEVCKLGDRNLYAYLPTEEKTYDIPVLVNTSFYLTATRENLHKDSVWNKWIIEQVPFLLLTWIAELVITEIGNEAYTILPSKISDNDELGKCYNKSLLDAKRDIAFIKNSDGELLKKDEAILDMTSLSEYDFVGKTPILNYKKRTQNELNFAENPFPDDISNRQLKYFGVSSFDWKDFPNMSIMTSAFKQKMSLENNKLLIEYLKYQSLSEVNKNVDDNLLKGWNFILDHREDIRAPRDLYFSEIGDNPEVDSVANYVHPQLEEWLTNNRDLKSWLEGLNIKVKSDETFLLNTILPNAENYSTLDNSIETIRKAAELLDNGDIGLDIPQKLSKLKIITTQGNLVPAENCYFPNRYNPRVSIEHLITDDIFINAGYIENNNLAKLKTLLIKMGVRENFILNEYPRTKKYILQQLGFDEEYFQLHKDFFWGGYFSSHSYQSISTFNLLNSTNNFEFAKLFWNDIIASNCFEQLKKQVTVFWGHDGKRGDTTGQQMENYIPWYIKNNACIPGKDGRCHNSSEIFLNSEEIVKIAGKHLPVFDGPILSDEWRSFFKFKTKLELSDYLNILTSISSNPDHKKSDQQPVFELILDDLLIYGPEEQEALKNWGSTYSLSDANDFYRSTNDLYFYVDGNPSDLDEGYNFAYFTQAIQKHSEFEKLLQLLGINIIRQSDFRVEANNKLPAESLTSKLEFIFPYWAQLRRSDVQGGFDQIFEELKDRYEKYIFFQADELTIKYGEKWYSKTIYYLSGNEFYVVKDWKKLSVLMSLANQLSQLLGAPKLHEQLMFLLLSDLKEIEEYFSFLQIPLPPPESVEEYNFEAPNNQIPKLPGFTASGRIPSEFYHISEADYSKQNYSKAIISRAVTKIISYLDKLPEYDCSNHYEIAESIIGGITKNGNEITVVARPSDDSYMLLYYSSEFDVLEYVDAELWCEDGINEPKQITLGQLLKKTGINKIPVKNIEVSADDLNIFLTTPKNEELDFDPVPYVPQKMARIISSFANTNGGSLVFGIKEINPEHNEIVGLSSDFRIDEITKKAISFLNPIPSVTYDWVVIEDKSVYLIKTEKSEIPILFDDKKYIRKENISFAEVEEAKSQITLNVPPYSRTVAIIIAIENYFPKNQMKQVKYAYNDAMIFRDMLVNSLDVKDDEISMFINEEAIQNSIEYEFKKLFNSLTENDRLIFYYAGHGFHNGMTNFLSTYDTHGNNILATSVPLNKILIDPLRNSHCKNALIFIDACATNIVDTNERNHWSNIKEEELILLSEDFPNYSIFLSCQAGQSSYSSDKLKNGIWTHHVVDALSGNVSEVMLNKKYVTDILLRDYLSTVVASYTMEEYGYDQNPTAIIDSSYPILIREIKS